MPMSLDKPDKAKLREIIRRTRDNVDEALEAHVASGKITRRHRSGLKLATQDTGRLLAQFLDGAHYEAVPWSTVEIIWNYNQMANDLLEAHMRVDDVKDTQERMHTGRYRLTRQLYDKNGIILAAHSVECTNPAVGLIKLDAWQDARP